MKAMVLEGVCDLRQNQTPLSAVEMPDPLPGRGEVLLQVTACGVCHTELDEIEGRTPPPVFPIIPGHQIVGRVLACGPGAQQHKVGDRLGVAWIHSACGQCQHCRRGDENLCPQFVATGRDVHGGYARLTTVPQRFALPIPEVFTDIQAAPFLCAGAIGYRSLRLTGLQNGQRLGLTGFGASGHLVLKLVRYRYPDAPVYVFARNPNEREFARELGAVWAGDTGDRPPESLDCIIDTTPAWKPVVEALKNLKAGGRLVINAIRKEAFDKKELLRIDYPDHLWMEKEIKSVANVARRDVTEFLQIAAEIPFLPEVQEYSLEQANTALLELKKGKIRGAKVLNLA
ncbi:MAG: alcohol dehydrogenase [Deltaproteobacteria bacterium SG8_13]|nr:MAG: alcohol dehydrogenase [Deltaproteobacteria bacterium SG8_13]